MTPEVPAAFPITANHLWCQQVHPLSDAKTVLFLDRDGVVVEDTHHLSRPQDVRVIDGAATLIRAANARRIAVVFVTNQSGIGQGLFTWTDFAAVQDEILRHLEADGAFVNAVIASPFHPKGTAPFGHPAQPYRKPLPGMLLTAAHLYDLPMSRGWIVGDRAGDMWAGRNAGLAGGVHVATGYGHEQRDEAGAAAAANFQIKYVDTVREALTALKAPLFR